MTNNKRVRLKRFGAPPKRKPQEGERVALSIRMTPALKKRLDSAAEEGGRSQSQEAEFRLERSFDRGDLLPEVLKIALGDRLAGIILMVAHGMMLAGYDELMRQDKRTEHLLSGRYHFLDDPTAYNQAVVAAHALLEACRPLGVPREGQTPHAYSAALTIQDAIVGKTSRNAPGQYPDSERAALIRGLLGPIASRVAEYPERSPLTGLHIEEDEHPKAQEGHPRRRA